MPMLSLCLHLSSLTIYLLIAAEFVINYGLECLPIWVLLIFHIPHIHCLNISLCWLFCNWGSKHSLVFYTLIEHSLGIRARALAMVSLPKCDPRPFLRWIDLNRLMLLHTLMGAIMPFGKSE